MCARSWIRYIEDPEVVEWIKEFVERPHPSTKTKKKKKKVGHIRFTDEQCRAFRKQYIEEKATVKNLAKENNCSYNTMYAVLTATHVYNHLGGSVIRNQRRSG